MGQINYTVVHQVDKPARCGNEDVNFMFEFGNLYIPYDLGTGTTLFGALQVVGAEDLVADDDITIRLGVQLD